MVKNGNRIDGTPYLIENNSISSIERIAFDKKVYQEDWIQNLINEQPDIIPISEIEPVFANLIPIGKEVGTHSGYIDNLFISPSGYITIVEAKLWRNPEAMRKVVAQIIDYAKELNKWSYSDLDKSVKKYNQEHNNNSNNIIETIKNNDNNFNENLSHKLIDRISTNLKQGKFLLLILGDGIRENTEEIVEFLSQTPQLNFTFALVELQVYEIKGQNKKLVIPQIITRTNEITRAVIKIENDNKNTINVIVPKEEENQNKNKRFKITKDNFFEELLNNTNDEIVNFAKYIIEDCENRGYRIKWGQASFIIIDNNKISLFMIKKDGTFYLGWSGHDNIDNKIIINRAINMAKLFPSAIFSEKKQNWEKYIKIEELKDNYNAFMTGIDKFANKIKQEFEKNN